jgi:hypothetical protein
MRAVTDMTADQKDWKNAAIGAGNLSELELTLGDVSAARRLIDKYGYHRRDEELSDAESALRALESL